MFLERRLDIKAKIVGADLCYRDVSQLTGISCNRLCRLIGGFSPALPGEWDKINAAIATQTQQQGTAQEREVV